MSELSDRSAGAPEGAPLSGAAAVGTHSRGHMIYATFLLSLVWMLAQADRNILAVLLSPIQQDLGASDTAMGALTGIAFAAVYATVMLPMSRIADRGNRRNVIALAVAFWSAMTALSGLATSYLTLLIARVGVAAGEASAMPSQMSIVGDLVPPKRRATALGFITVGSSLGIALGALVAGRLSDLYGWQVAFFALGAPGLLLAVLFYFTVPEPARGGFEGGDRPDPESLSWWKSLKYLVRVPSIPPVLVAKVLVTVAFMAYLAWLPTYLIRVHGLSTSTMSLWFGVSTGVGAVLANGLGGIISDHLVRRGPRWRMYYLAAMLFAGAPMVAVVVLSTTTPLVIVMMLVYSLVTGGASSVGLAAGLDIVRPRMRGFMTAAIGLCTWVIGAGGGPVLIGAISDSMKATHGHDALRYSLVIVPVMLVLASFAYLWASRTADRDAALARGEEPPPA